MTEYQFIHFYVEGFLRRLVGRVIDDERGDAAQTIVLVGVALLMAAAVAAIIWGKLQDGANNIQVPVPGGP
jgi:hypothetical protein